MIHHLEVQVLILLAIAAVVGMAARRRRLPYTLALVVAGLVLGIVHIDALHGLALSPNLPLNALPEADRRQALRELLQEGHEPSASAPAADA